MPPLSNKQHEQFAQLVAGGKKQSDASEAIGHDGSRSNASKLARKPSVRDRIAELRAQRVQHSMAAIDPTMLTGSEIVKHGLRAAWDDGDPVKIVDAGLKVGKSDGSLSEFQPKTVHDLSDEGLASAMLPFIPGAFEAIKLKVPDDARLMKFARALVGSNSFDGRPAKLTAQPPEDPDEITA